MLLKLAARNALRNPRRSAYTILAVSFGLFCLIVFTALKVGLHREMVRSTVNLDTGSLQIHAAGFQPNLASLKPLKNKEAVEAALKAEGVEVFAARLRSPALILAREQSSTVLVTGVDPEREGALTFIRDSVVKGSYVGGSGGVVMGENIAQGLGVGLGDEITLMAQDAGGKAVARKFRVEGLYATALASFNRTHLFLHRDALADFLRAGDAVTEIAARVEEERVEAVAKALEARLDPKVHQVRTWKEAAPDVWQLINLNDSTMALLTLIVFAIVVMGIVNTMSMAVYERFHEVGVMLGMGAGPRAIFSVFMLESAVLGVLSAFAGTLFGLLACLYLAEYGVDLTSLTSSNEYFATSHVLKAHLLLSDLLWQNLLTIAAALLAGVFPALKAVRLEAVEALNHG